MLTLPAQLIGKASPACQVVYSLPSITSPSALQGKKSRKHLTAIG